MSPAQVTISGDCDHAVKRFFMVQTMERLAAATTKAREPTMKLRKPGEKTDGPGTDVGPGMLAVIAVGLKSSQASVEVIIWQLSTR